jgi:hypothetical protein
MKWLKLDNYCIKSDEWFIAKYYKADGSVKYGLSNKNTNHGYFDTANDAKAKAQEINNGKV